MPKACSFASCDNDGSLVKRLHEPTDTEYWYCERHDPLDDSDTWQFVEVDDD